MIVLSTVFAGRANLSRACAEQEEAFFTVTEGKAPVYYVDQIISASTVRRALQEGDMEAFRTLVPETTSAWFESPGATAVLERIRRAKEVVHY